MTYKKPIWEGVYNSFCKVPAKGAGFDGETWIRNLQKKIIELKNNSELNVPLPPPSNYREALLPLLASLVVNEQRKARILDFGGGIGLAYYQTIYGLPRPTCIDYHIVERESVCRAGTQFFRATDDNPFFHSLLPEGENEFDIVHAGSALQYIDDWRQVASRLCSLSRKYLLLVDIPAGNNPTFAAAQNYYGSKIPVWFFNIEEFLSFIGSRGYNLLLKSAFQPTILGVEQSLPMQNYEEKYQIKTACNLFFIKAHRHS